MPCIGKKSAGLSLSIALTLGCAIGTADAASIADILERVRAEAPAGANGEAAAIPPALIEFANSDLRSAPRDRVLNEMHAGVIAMQLGEHRYATPLFMDAHTQIETIYANDPNAAAARSRFVPDANKDFKGDAYERAMLGYYLGLSYMLNGDMENARASFRWGEFQDTMSASESYQSDMASLVYLRAWVAKCQGDTTAAGEEFTAANRVRATLPIPTAEDNVLVVVESGSSPVKVGTGKYRENLSFQRGALAPSPGISVAYANRTIPLGVGEDVYWQASTLGGRAVDKILAGKASFKQGAETTANVAGGIAQASLLTASSALSAGNIDIARNLTGVAGAGMLIGLGAKMFAEKAKPAADIRYWSNLPDQVWLGTGKFDKTNSGAVSFKEASGAESHTQAFTVQPTGSCYLAYVREQPNAAPKVVTTVAPAAAPAEIVRPQAVVAPAPQSYEAPAPQLPRVRDTTHDNTPVPIF